MISQRTAVLSVLLYLFGLTTSGVTTGIQDLLICQGKTETIQCVEGKVIYIHHAYYGRADIKTCSSGEVKHRVCQEGSHAVIWGKCEGMSECELTASDDAMAATRCLEESQYTYHKYISVVYRCDVPGETQIGTCGSQSTWGGWLSIDNPEGPGDVELLRDHQNLNDGCRYPSAIDIRLRNGGDYRIGEDVLRIGINFGVLCLHERQNRTCNDYKVRYCCVKKRDEKCSNPGTIKNGFVTRRFKKVFRIGESVRYRCRRNFALSGEAVLTCKIGAEWSHKVPECKKIVSCGTLKSIKYGKITYKGSRNVGGTASYSCDEGYTLIGSRERTCLNNGEWSAANPKCESICEKNKIYNKCKPFCSPTCLDRFDVPNMECEDPAECEPGCSCPAGMVELDRADDTCVKQTACPRRKVCKAYGDPHYIMFDASGTFDFMGRCTYTMSETFGLGLSDERWFSIQVESEARRNVTYGSWVKNVKIILEGGLTEILLDKSGAKINGVNATDSNSWLFVLRISGNNLDVTTTFGVTITFNGNAVIIRMPTTYRNLVRGLCGNINGNSTDDLIMANGEYAEDFIEMARSFQVDNCDKLPGTLRDCSDEDKTKWTDNDFCGSLLDRTGVFRECIDAVSITQKYFDACIFDMCATGGDQNVLLENLQSYFEECKESQVDVPCNWRKSLNLTTPDCPPNSNYVDCPQSCHNYCFNNDKTSSRCTEPIAGGCFCQSGYVWEGTKCIREEECGCEVDGAYFPKDTVLSRSEAGVVCTCAGKREVVCGCDEGFVLDNSECREATCEDNICDTNAECTGSGKDMLCSCNAGFSGNGRECNLNTCEILGTMENGIAKLNGSNKIGDSVNYQCDFGYILQGDAQRFCNSDGQWSGSEPYCEKICKEPMIYHQCVDNPPLSCLDKYDLPKEEGAICSPGCRCPSGMMMIDRYNRTCVTKRQCPKRGVCRAWGDPHYIMFEGSSTFDFMKLCNLTLLEPVSMERNDSRWLVVIAENEMRPKITAGSFVKNAKIQLDNGNIDILLEKNGAKVNGEPVSDLRTPLFNLHSTGKQQLVTTYHGVTIIYNGNAVIIKAPTLYRDEVRGLCGDFNGVSGDDFRARDGTIKESVTEYASSYEVGECLQESFPTARECTEEDKQKWSKDGYCGSMANGTGIFADCLTLLETAESFFEGCLFDMCATQGDLKTLLENFAAFVDECKEVGAAPCNWRQELGFQDLTCFPKSHYVECPNSCPRSCYRNVECSNPNEGRCECDDGLFIEGANCIPESDCGCVVNGEYFTKGTIRDDYDANISCICAGPGQFRCECLIGYIQDGDICRLESCQDNVCDENADCSDTDFGIECTCRQGFVGDGWSCRPAVVSCIRPQPFLNGFIAHNIPPYTKDKLLIYECNIGYRLIGNPTRVCMDTGKWSSPSPTCRRRGTG